MIARERLGLLKDLCRINQEMRELDHFQDSMHGRDLTRFTDRAQGRMQHLREAKLIHKYNFEPDPVEKMNLHLPLIKEEHRGSDNGGDGEDIAKVITAKDLNKHRVQLRKSNFEQCVADRRNRRRPFWDKAVLGSQKQQSQKDRNGFFRPHRVGMFGGHVEPAQHAEGSEQWEPRKARGPFKSPSLPALNTLRRLDTDRVHAVHPSLSDRRSASMDYLPVIQGTKGQHLFFASPKAPTLSGSTLPTIAEA